MTLAQSTDDGSSFLGIPSDAWENGGYFIIILVFVLGLFRLLKYVADKAVIPWVEGNLQWQREQAEETRKVGVVLSELNRNTQVNTQNTQTNTEVLGKMVASQERLTEEVIRRLTRPGDHTV